MNLEQLDLTISIVSGGDLTTLSNCLQSLLQSLDGSIAYEIFVIDNARGNLSGGFQAQFPQVKVICNDHMRGFAANHNQVLKRASGRYVLILNDDTIIQPNFCQALLSAADKYPSAGLLGPRILNQDSSLQISAFRFPSPTRALFEAFALPKLFPNNQYVGDYRNWNHDTETEVESLIGAALLCRRQMWQQIGELDEDFYMYSEDHDWCWRARQAGWKVRLVPQAQMIHLGGRSTASMASARQIETLRSNERFQRKHFGESGLLIYNFCSLVRHIALWLYSAILSFRPGQKKWYRTTVLWTLGLLKEEGLQEIAGRTNL